MKDVEIDKTTDILLHSNFMTIIIVLTLTSAVHLIERRDKTVSVFWTFISLLLCFVLGLQIYKLYLNVQYHDTESPDYRRDKRFWYPLIIGSILLGFIVTTSCLYRWYLATT